MSPHAFHPVMTCAEAREFERAFFDGDADGSRVRGAMRMAACGVARETRRLLDETSGDASRLVVLCGKGRNAGDALLAAGELLTPGAECLVCAPEGVARLSAEAARALEHLMSKSGAGVRVAESWDCEFVRRPCVILDGLTGSGFRPPLSGAMREAVLGANRCENALRVAVDLPSGAGDKSDAPLFAAHLTVATGILKSPMLSPEARASAGRIRYADIGFFDGGAPESSVSVVSPAGLRELDATRHAMSDKRDHGHVAVIGGHRMMPGALLLNVLGALRAGAGLVTAFCTASVHAAFAAAAPEAMWVGWPCLRNPHAQRNSRGGGRRRDKARSAARPARAPARGRRRGRDSAWRRIREDCRTRGRRGLFDPRRRRPRVRRRGRTQGALHASR